MEKIKESDVMIIRLVEQKRPAVEWILTGDLLCITPIKHVCNNPKLNSQRIVLNRLTNQPMNIPQNHPTYKSDLEALVALRKKFRDEVRHLNTIIRDRKKLRKK